MQCIAMHPGRGVLSALLSVLLQGISFHCTLQMGWSLLSAGLTLLLLSCVKLQSVFFYIHMMQGYEMMCSIMQCNALQCIQDGVC